MKLIKDRKECCGCGACLNICPVNAIFMQVDKKGFLYPEINEEKCISCNLCEKVCDFKKNHAQESNIKKAYALVVKNKDELKKSTSGGAFTAFSDIILKENGIISGTVLDAQFNVRYTFANTVMQRNMMRGSKYVQSNTGLIFREIKKKLDKRQTVMFVGCPCQTAALKAYLGKEENQLILIDFLCHGVPNNNFFKEHISYMEQKLDLKAKNYSWREKKYGWFPNYIEGIQSSSGKWKYSYEGQAYVQMFWTGMSLRGSCFNCKYRSYHRESDITIADFWGIEQFWKRKDYNGVSLVFVNSEKGEQLINKINRCHIYLEEIPCDKVKYRIATKPVPCPKQRDEFWYDYENYGYAYLLRKYMKKRCTAKLKFVIKKIYRRLIMSYINKIQRG